MWSVEVKYIDKEHVGWKLDEMKNLTLWSGKPGHAGKAVLKVVSLQKQECGGS